MKREIYSFSNKIEFNDKEYYPIINLNTKEEHLIPCSQIELFKSFDSKKKYEFKTNFIKSKNRTYLTIIHPKYPINAKIKFAINDIKEFYYNKYFMLDSDYFEPLSVECFDWQKDLTHVQCRVIDYKRGKPILRNIDTTNSKWNVDDIAEFKIKGKSLINGKRGEKIEALELFIDNTETQKVKIFEWQKLNHWKYDNLKCKVNGINSYGKPILMPFDDRHPYYKIGNVYNFIYERSINKVDNKGSKFSVIKLLDEHLLSYSVKALPNQKIDFKEGDKIECKVEDICFKVKLKQVYKDPFFYKYNEIESDKYSYDNFFLPYLNRDEEFSSRLRTQYQGESAFWVFTYCNKVIPYVKNDLIKNYNLLEIKRLVDNQLLFENWILKSGILKAFSSSDDRKLVKKKVEDVIYKCQIERNIIDKINDFSLNEYIENEKTKISYIEIYYIIQYSTIQTLSVKDFLNFEKVEEEDLYFIEKVIKSIERQKNDYYLQSFKQYFVPASKKDNSEIQRFYKYLEWTYLQLKFNELIGDIRNKNLQTANIYRFYSQISTKSKERRKLLLNAFDVLTNINENNDYSAIDLNGKLEINIEKLNSFSMSNEQLDLSKTYKSEIIEKHYKGFKVKVGNYSGYLPIHNISDNKLKNYPFSEIKWETNVELSLVSEDFNFAIVKQLPLKSYDYLSKNLKSIPKLKQGAVINGIVKAIEEYGIFIKTNYGDGLLRINQVSINMINAQELDNIFKVGEKVCVKVVQIKGDKIELSLKELKGTEYEDYYITKTQLNDIDLNNSNDYDDEYDFESIIEFNKGLIFENYAIIQEDNDEKIKYLKLAKAFYSNPSNQRSYLLNIYIEYFQSLSNLDELLNNYSIENYDRFKKNILEIKDKLQPQTLETFPESQNLLFFIDILKLFNSKEDSDIISLFSLIKTSIEKNDFKLKTVAKIVLANNLMISDIKEQESKEELNEFTFKNLRNIQKFLNYGIYSVEEIVEDKHSKELKEKIKYIKGLISQDEGQKLEFKSTFKTPIPPKEKQIVIDNLEKKLDKTNDPEQKEKITSKIEKIKEQSTKAPNIEKRLYHEVFKTLCAFANTDGGILLIGVNDDQKVFGLEQDYNSFKKSERNRDGFAKHFDNLVSNYLGKDFSSSYLKTDIVKFPEGDVFLVEVKPSTEEIFLSVNENGEKDDRLYVRNTASSVELKGQNLAKFVKNKFEKRLHSYNKTYENDNLPT